jgi:hypothetical protein
MAAGADSVGERVGLDEARRGFEAKVDGPFAWCERGVVHARVRLAKGVKIVTKHPDFRVDCGI